MILTRISKEDIYNYPQYAFEGEIILIDTKEAVKEACEHISSFKFCGIDTEREPCYQKGVQNPIALLQISTPDQVVYLFHILKIGIPQDLLDILENDQLLKVGIALKDDRDFLVQYRAHDPKCFIELPDITEDQLYIANKGAKALATILLGFRISKKCQRSHWGNESLSQDQIIYAATDAWICSEMLMKLLIEGAVEMDNVKNYVIP